MIRTSLLFCLSVKTTSSKSFLTFFCLYWSQFRLFTKLFTVLFITYSSLFLSLYLAIYSFISISARLCLCQLIHIYHKYLPKSIWLSLGLCHDWSLSRLTVEVTNFCCCFLSYFKFFLSNSDEIFCQVIWKRKKC